MEKGSKLTVVLGASSHPHRYSYIAVQRLAAHHHPVVAIGRSGGAVGDIAISSDTPQLEGVDTVTLYLNPDHQKAYYDYILSLKPRRIIFNPGAENAELARLARENHIEPVEACTLVLLGTGQY